MTAIRSLCTQWKSFRRNAPAYIFAQPMKNNIFHWRGQILGPPNTPFEDGVFMLDIIYTEEHPIKPPKYTMKTKMFHPNISSTGEIYIGILDRDWVPFLTVEQILLSISSILDTPVMDNPINREAARLFRNDRVKYNSIVREHTLKYANEYSIYDENDQDLHAKMLHTEIHNSSSCYLPNFLLVLMILTTIFMFFLLLIQFFNLFFSFF